MPWVRLRLSRIIPFYLHYLQWIDAVISGSNKLTHYSRPALKGKVLKLYQYNCHVDTLPPKEQLGLLELGVFCLFFWFSLIPIASNVNYTAKSTHIRLKGLLYKCNYIGFVSHITLSCKKVFPFETRSKSLSRHYLFIQSPKISSIETNSLTENSG